MVWDLIVFFTWHYTKVDQDHMSCNFASHQIKNIHSRLVGKRPSGNVEKTLLPRKLPPCVGDFRFAVKMGKNNVTTTQGRKTGRTRHMKRAVLRTNSRAANIFTPVRLLQKRTVLCHSNRCLPNIVEGPEPCLWKTQAEPKNTKTDNCK